jgi:hypothetical protein
MMKYYCLSLFCFFSISISAQTKQKAEAEFLQLLNKVVKISISQHWAYEDPFTIDSAFHITGDTITATIKFTDDSGFYRIRYAAPVSKISSIDRDVYFILRFPGRMVNMYESINGKEWSHFDKRNLFHIGAVSLEEVTYDELLEELELAWAKLSYYYE